METIDYFSLVTDAFDRLSKLHRQRETIDAEIIKLEQFLSASANMLPDNARELAMRRLEVMQELYRVRDAGLTDAIRAVLRASAGDWLTATNVRDRLITIGFDFSTYTANPLASVSTTLRRMKPEEVESTTVDGGVAAYRWKQPSQAEKAEAIRKAKLRSPFGQPKRTLSERIQDFEDAVKKK